MPYINQRGQQQYTLKEKIAYHNKCANSGKGPDGEKLSMTQRMNHTRASARARGKLNTFMNTVGVVNSSKRGK